MDVMYSSSDVIISHERNSVFAVDPHEADMLNFGFDFADYDMPLNSSGSHNFSGVSHFCFRLFRTKQ